MTDNPDIMPRVFSLEEFRKDYQLYKDLAPIASQIEQLSDSLQNTMIALASDTLVATLEIYQAVKATEPRDQVLMGISCWPSTGERYFRDLFAAGALAYDMMYGKGETPFLQLAREQGAGRCADGLGMLVEQAAEAFFVWRAVRPVTGQVLADLRAKLAA